jgi:hypothetical protein
MLQGATDSNEEKAGNLPAFAFSWLLAASGADGAGRLESGCKT